MALYIFFIFCQELKMTVDLQLINGQIEIILDTVL